MVALISAVFCFWIVLIVLSAFVDQHTNKLYAWILAVLLMSLAVGCWATIIHTLLSRT